MMVNILFTLLQQEQLDLAAIKSYLTELNLPPHKPEELASLLGPQTFELAKVKNNLALFQILLDFDLPVPVDYDNSGLDPEIIALLDSRGAWQREVQQGEAGLVFNRLTQLVELSLQVMQADQTPEGIILIMGGTGKGKSTLCNYMHGVDYRLQEGQLGISEKCEVKEVAQVGTTVASQTLFPQSYSLPGLTCQWVDLAGKDDNKGTNYEICAAIANKILTEKIQHIRGIALALTLDDLKDPKLTPYTNIAADIGHILEANPSLNQHLILLVTKSGSVNPAEIAKKAILDLPEEIVASLSLEQIEKIRQNAIERNKKETEEKQQQIIKQFQQWLKESVAINSTPLTGAAEIADTDYRNKAAIQRVTQRLLASPNAIVVADVTRPEARELIRHAIEELPPPRSHTEFNFSTYHHLIERYHTKFMVFNRYRTQLINELTIQTEAYNTSFNRLQALQQQQTVLARGADIDARIQTNQDEITQLETQRQTYQANLTALQQYQCQLNIVLARLQRQQQLLITANPSPPSNAINESIIASCCSLLTSSAQAFCVCQQQLHMIEQLISTANKLRAELREEKIMIETIRQGAEDNLENRLAELQQEMDIAKTRRDAAQLTFNVNQAFFERLNRLAEIMNIQPIERPIHTIAQSMSVGFFQLEPQQRQPQQTLPTPELSN